MKKLILSGIVTLISANSFATKSVQAQDCQKAADVAISAYTKSLSATHVIAGEGFEVLKAGEHTFIGEDEVQNALDSTVTLYFYELATAGLNHHIFIKITPACEVISIHAVNPVY